MPGREDGLCGAPGTTPNSPVQPRLPERLRASRPAYTSSYTAASLVKGNGNTNALDPLNPQYTDQYVAKHFPFPWFASLTGGGSGNPMGTPLTEPSSAAPTATPTTSTTSTIRPTA